MKFTTHTYPKFMPYAGDLKNRAYPVQRALTKTLYLKVQNTH